jgi:hypothetical protein
MDLLLLGKGSRMGSSKTSSRYKPSYKLWLSEFSKCESKDKLQSDHHSGTSVKAVYFFKQFEELRRFLLATGRPFYMQVFSVQPRFANPTGVDKKVQRRLKNTFRGWEIFIHSAHKT